MPEFRAATYANKYDAEAGAVRLTNDPPQLSAAGRAFGSVVVAHSAAQ
jgi:hypothetical protein